MGNGQKLTLQTFVFWSGVGALFMLASVFLSNKKRSVKAITSTEESSTNKTTCFPSVTVHPDRDALAIDARENTPVKTEILTQSSPVKKTVTFCPKVARLFVPDRKDLAKLVDTLWYRKEDFKKFRENEDIRTNSCFGLK